MSGNYFFVSLQANRVLPLQGQGNNANEEIMLIDGNNRAVKQILFTRKENPPARLTSFVSPRDLTVGQTKQEDSFGLSSYSPDPT